MVVTMDGLLCMQMEKTVNINENSQFLEDLELLRAANGEGDRSSMPRFMEEDAMNPHLSENHLLDSGFMHQGSNNPLEKLGLYRKDDDGGDDDDDDGDHPIL